MIQAATPTNITFLAESSKNILFPALYINVILLTIKFYNIK